MGPPAAAVLVDAATSSASSTARFTPSGVRKRPTAIRGFCASTKPFAISFARVRRLYFGASDPKGGGVEHGPRIFSQPTCHHRPEVYGGIDEARAAALLRRFFEALR